MPRKRRTARQRSAAAKKGWVTRRHNQEFARRSAAAKKGWATRQASKTKKRKQHQEYLLTIKNRGSVKGGPKKTKSPLPDKKKLPDLLVIFYVDRKFTEVFDFAMDQLPPWQQNIWRHAKRQGLIKFFAGHLTTEALGVHDR